MDWYRAKTILIAFLVMTNLVLLYYLVSDGLKSENSDALVSDSVVELLAQKNITVDKNLIKDTVAVDSMDAKSLDNCIKDYEEFAKGLLGTEVLKTDSNKFANNVATIQYSGDYFEVNKSTSAPVYNKEINRTNVINVTKEYLKSAGIELSGAKERMIEENGEFSVIFEKQVDDFCVFDTIIEVKLSKYGIENLKGIWYNTKNTAQTRHDIKGISSALIEYMNKNNHGQNITIKDAKLGYSTLEYNVYHENVVLTPVWRITDTNGVSVNIDARQTKQ